MKKKLILLLLLLIPFVVKAEEGPFSKAFATQDTYYIFDTVEFKDGYVFIGTNEDGDFIRYYDNQGTLKKEIPVGQYMPYVVFTKGDYLYVLEMMGERIRGVDGPENILVQYDSNFNKVKELDIGDEFSAGEMVVEINFMVTHIKYKEDITIKDGKIYLPDWQNDKIIVVNDNMTLGTPLTITDENEMEMLRNYYPLYYKLKSIEQIDPELGDSISYNFSTPIAFNDNYTLINKTVKTCDSDNVLPPYSTSKYKSTPYYFDECYTTTIALYDKNSTKLWSRVLGDGAYGVVNMALLDDFIVVSVVRAENNALKIYDYEGNLVQEIITESNIVNTSIAPVNKGFVMTTTNINPFKIIPYMIGDKDPIPNHMMASNYLDYDDDEDDAPIEHNEVYILNKKIEKATDGNGEIDVKTRAIPGEVVTINVTPKKGYTLSELIVIDEAGNQLKVTNNTFVMGESKVVVRASFIPYNPNTGNYGLMIIVALAAISGVLLIIQKKRLDFLK